MHIANACLEISKLLKTLKSAVIWTGFKIQHRNTINLASSSPVFNLPFLEKVGWKGAASQTQHLSSSNFWIAIIQASGRLLEGRQNIIYCGQWSPWGGRRKPDVGPDAAGQSAAASTLTQEVFSEWSCLCLPWSVHSAFTEVLFKSASLQEELWALMLGLASCLEARPR